MPAIVVGFNGDRDAENRLGGSLQKIVGHLCRKIVGGDICRKSLGGIVGWDLCRKSLEGISAESVMLFSSYAHTMVKPPDPIRTPKLSTIGPAQYCGGGPRGNRRWCTFLKICTFLLDQKIPEYCGILRNFLPRDEPQSRTIYSALPLSQSPGERLVVPLARGNSLISKEIITFTLPQRKQP